MNKLYLFKKGTYDFLCTIQEPERGSPFVTVRRDRGVCVLSFETPEAIPDTKPEAVSDAEWQIILHMVANRYKLYPLGCYFYVAFNDPNDADTPPFTLFVETVLFPETPVVTAPVAFMLGTATPQRAAPPTLPTAKELHAQAMHCVEQGIFARQRGAYEAAAKWYEDAAGYEAEAIKSATGALSRTMLAESLAEIANQVVILIEQAKEQNNG